jgi:hypothetical protein
MNLIIQMFPKQSVIFRVLVRCHDTRHDGIQYNDTEHSSKKCDSQHNGTTTHSMAKLSLTAISIKKISVTFSMMILNIKNKYLVSYYAEYTVSVIMLSLVALKIMPLCRMPLSITTSSNLPSVIYAKCNLCQVSFMPSVFL